MAPSSWEKLEAAGLTKDLNRSQNTSQIRELYKTETEKLRQQKELCRTLHDKLMEAREVSEHNVRAMKVAVSLSQQPGSIDYRQIPMPQSQTAALMQDISAVLKNEAEVSSIRLKVSRLDTEERSRWTAQASASCPGSLEQWLNKYGSYYMVSDNGPLVMRPKRSADKAEKYLSYIQPARHIVQGAKSKNGTVWFNSEKSVAKPLRKGILLD